MSEEKKLTDKLEEMYVSGKFNGEIIFNAIKTIYALQEKNAEQKAEIKQLEKDVHDMSWIIKMHKYCVGADHCQNSSMKEFKLQKQVDELTVRTSELFQELQEEKRAYARAVKDTAKEILTDAKKWVKEHYKDKITDSFGEREMLFMEAFGCLLAYLKDKHGVEVE